MAEERNVKLQRRQAMKRKGFIREGIISRLDDSASEYSEEDENEKNDIPANQEEEGSSVDLTPTLLGIYDKIANQDGEEGPNDQLECGYFVTNEFLNDGSGNQCHSVESSPIEKHKDFTHKYQSHDRFMPISRHEWDIEENNNRIKMLSADKKESLGLDGDNKKRPLSISSMSSSSTSSLPRRRKRPNLCEYSDTSSSTQLDIEKLDNLLYIDDSPENEAGGSKHDDEMYLYAMNKRKSGGDTDSQTSASNQGDQSEHLHDTLTTYQSDLSLSYTPSNSTNCSTADLSLNSDLTMDTENDQRPRRSPSRSSQKGQGIMRSANSSFKQSGHYVSYVQRVVSELVETERIYVSHLEDIKVGYYQTITESRSISITGQERECLFGNILEIYEFSCRFYQELEDCGMDPIKVAECFVRNNEGFVIYADYCTNYPSAVAVLNKVMYDQKLNEAFKHIQLSLGHSLPLGAYLLKPVQRVLKYHLLLQNILKHYSENDPGHEKLTAALNHMTAMSHQINEMKRKHEHAVRLQEIQSQLEDYEGEDFTRLGELVLEGSFRMFGVKASRQVFLFEKGLIIAKRKEDGMFSCKAYIPCANLMLVESIPREPLNFQILPFDNPKGAHTIHARNLEQKRKWCQEMKRLILESYASKIPDNVKDLIIENMGKSKDEDVYAQLGVMDSGKSHVTTPDYLEKRTKNRRKSGTLIPEILKPQRARKMHGRNRNETPSPKTPSSMDNIYNKSGLSGLKSKLSPLAWKDREENDPYGTAKLTTPQRRSVNRSQSFQMSNRDSSTPDQFSRKYGNDSMSMDDLSYPEGSVVRTNSFRMATTISPIRLDSHDEMDSGHGPKTPEHNKRSSRVLTENKNIDNLSPAIKKSIEKELDKLDHSYGAKETYDNNKPDNLNGSYLEEGGSQRYGRYASMPVLNRDPNMSPKMSRLGSESTSRGPHSGTNNGPKSPFMNSRTIDPKQYFAYRDRNSASPLFNDKQNENGLPSAVPAFHDAFANLRKSQENLQGKSITGRKLTLTQPKPFQSTLKSSASLLASQARLNKWAPGERFTKGSMTDLSHLREDPWIRNKQRAFTESKLMFKGPKSSLKATIDQNRRSLDVPDSYTEHQGQQAPGHKKHQRTQSLCTDGDAFSRDNLDWIVYANRNSIPVSDFSMEEINRRFKYCTPPRDDMIPPHGTPADKYRTLPQNVVSTYGRYGTDQSPMLDYSKASGISNADSSVSLSATTTSSETCSSPDILKDAVFDDSGSAEKFFPQGKSGLSRSLSTPDHRRGIRGRRHLDDERPVSVLGEMSHLEESEKLVEEMERYMKRSTSSSGSLNSLAKNRFPTTIPIFEKHAEHKHHNKNRDSCISTGSASSYESTGQVETYENQHDEGLVDSIKHKFHNITSKFTGKKLNVSGSHSTYSSSVSPPNSPVRYKQEDHPTKLIPSFTHNLSIKAKQGTSSKYTEPDLSTILREKEPGSKAIGERMANTDLDDYATFSLPRTQLSLSPVPFEPIDSQETTPTPDVPEVNKKPNRIYGRFSNSNLPSPKPSGMLHADSSRVQSKSHSKLNSADTSTKSLNKQQSDSAFSIQSAEIESSSSGDSPREDSVKSDTTVKQLRRKSSEADMFYERRLSEVFNSDEAFRDSAVYCDDIDAPTIVAPPTEKIVPTKVPIREYVQHLEEKNKQKQAPTLKIKVKEPTGIIKQRIESLAANAETRNSSNTSCSISSSTSRAHSRSSSRASSEERQLSSGYGLKEFMGKKFSLNTAENEEERVLRSQLNNNSIKPAFSMSRLDQMGTDIENLVVMKGWVKDLVEKFQAQK